MLSDGKQSYHSSQPPRERDDCKKIKLKRGPGENKLHIAVSPDFWPSTSSCGRRGRREKNLSLLVFILWSSSASAQLSQAPKPIFSPGSKPHLPPQGCFFVFYSPRPENEIQRRNRHHNSDPLPPPCRGDVWHLQSKAGCVGIEPVIKQIDDHLQQQWERIR